MGTQTLLDFAKTNGIRQFVFASSSSVYGNCPNVPWTEDEPNLRPISPYASTKLAGEHMGHVYSHLYGIRFIGLRFFTVFGPRQRPDLAIHKFAKMILAGEAIPFFGDGTTGRDYTYVSDTVSGILGALAYGDSMYEIFNLGNHRVVTLTDMVAAIGTAVGQPVLLNHLPMQPGDVDQTCASVEKAGQKLGYTPETNFETGLTEFNQWLTATTILPSYHPTTLPSNG
jgi:UDP-glucuronate 4-epimerase